MTDDLAPNGPGGADASPDNRVVIETDAGKGSPGSGTDWVAGLSEDNRALVAAKKWTSPDDPIKSYRELETHASKAIVPPGENATAEDWNKFYGKLGRPEKPDGYALKVDRQTLPEAFPYDETMAVDFRTWAHEAGLTPSQAQKLHDKFVGTQAKSFTGMAEQGVQRETAAHREFTTKWGEPTTEAFKTNVELMSRAASQLGIMDSLKAGGFVGTDGAIRDAKMGLALARVGKELFAEDSFAASGSGVLENPFSKEHLNLTKQGQLIRDEPNKARALIRSAGGDPARFGL